MMYDLYMADRLYSSWSLRGWLLFEKFGVPYRVRDVGLYAGTMAADMAPVSPARLVPAIATPDGTVVGESLAIAETLAERHPEAGIWPADPACRATARWLCAEMATGFGALRGECPMQLRQCYTGFTPSEAVLGDLERLAVLWAHARAVSGAAEGWLMGAFSAVDVFFAPVVARITGYGLPVGASAHSYCQRWLADPAFLQWRADALACAPETDPYALDLPARPWPGDAG